METTNLSLDFTQVVNVVRQLSMFDKIKLREILNAETKQIIELDN